MTKSTRVFCLLALAAALFLSVFLLAGFRRQSADLASLEKALAASRETWETVAAEKEALQKELSALSDDLREAQLTYSESETRASELREENALLESDIASLVSQLQSLGIDPSASPVSD